MMFYWWNWFEVMFLCIWEQVVGVFLVELFQFLVMQYEDVVQDQFGYVLWVGFGIGQGQG